MGDIEFRCKYCGKSLVIDSRGAGMCVPCVDCGQQLTVPWPPEDIGFTDNTEISAQPKYHLKKPNVPPHPAARKCPKCGAILAPYEQICARCEAAGAKRSSGAKISVQLAGASTSATLIIALLVAIAGNVTWQWLASYIGELPPALDDIAGLFVIIAPLYVALKLIGERGFGVGLLCVAIYLGGITGGDAIFISYMDSSIFRNMYRNRESFAENYAYILAGKQADSEGLVIENDDQWAELAQRNLPEATRIMPTLSKVEFDELSAIMLRSYREMPLADQIIGLNKGENIIWIIIGVCIAFWSGLREQRE